MDLKAVRAFVAIADAGQFQKAAVDLSLTQQAVSKRIAALEKDLGVRLLVRRRGCGAYEAGAPAACPGPAPGGGAGGGGRAPRGARARVDVLGRRAARPDW
ncbi:HTH-type transcriptional regulator ArgP [Streptomyces violarus]